MASPQHIRNVSSECSRRLLRRLAVESNGIAFMTAPKGEFRHKISHDQYHEQASDSFGEFKHHVGQRSRAHAHHLGTCSGQLNPKRVRPSAKLAGWKEDDQSRVESNREGGGLTDIRRWQSACTTQAWFVRKDVYFDLYGLPSTKACAHLCGYSSQAELTAAQIDAIPALT